MRIKIVQFTWRLCGLCALATMFALSGCGKSSESGKDTSPAPVPPGEHPPRATTEVADSAKALRAFEKLKGRWLRPDGGYILEIKSVDASGKLDAAYFNPNPISVTNAVARIEGDDIKLLIELSGANYPGSRYELTYISAAGLMAGTYYQALLQQTFDVAFERAR